MRFLFVATIIGLSVVLIFTKVALAKSQISAVPSGSTATIQSGKSVTSYSSFALSSLLFSETSENDDLGLLGLFFFVIGAGAGIALGYWRWGSEVARLQTRIQVLKRIQNE